MVIIELTDLLFDGLHGVYPQEKLTGNRFVVNCRVGYREQQPVVQDLHDTLNYVSVYEVIQEKMLVPVPLLETLAMEIGWAIHRMNPYIRFIEIQIKKLHLPVIGMQGSVAVAWHKEF